MESERRRISNSDVVSAVEAVANPLWQEDFDNTGWQTGNPEGICTGVLVCVDATPEIVEEAAGKGFNMILSHHPLLFRGVKQVLPGKGRVEDTLISLIRNGISLYSSHTALDSAPSPYGVSFAMARRIGLKDVEPLTTTPGLGAIGSVAEPKTLASFASQVKETLQAPAVRLSRPVGSMEDRVCRVALCGGSGIEFIDAAIAAGADTYITSDVKLNWFLDRRDSINLIEVGHYEAEECAREVLRDIVAEAFPGLPVMISETETNPVYYI